MPEIRPLCTALGSAPLPPWCAASQGRRSNPSILGGTTHPQRAAGSWAVPGNKSSRITLPPQVVTALPGAVPCHQPLPPRRPLPRHGGCPDSVPVAGAVSTALSAPCSLSSQHPRVTALFPCLARASGLRCGQCWGAAGGYAAHLTPKRGRWWLLLLPCPQGCCLLDAAASSSPGTLGQGGLGNHDRAKPGGT